MCPDYGTDQEKLWKKLVEFQAYNDRVLELLARLGNHIKIIFRYRGDTLISTTVKIFHSGVRHNKYYCLYLGYHVLQP